MSDLEIEQFYAQGFAQYAAGQLAKAADLFRRLCTDRPLDPRFWFGLGATLQEAKSYPLALNAWAMASLLTKEDPMPHFHAAECYLSLQNVGEALKALEAAESRLSGEHPLRDRIQLFKEQWSGVA